MSRKRQFYSEDNLNGKRANNGQDDRSATLGQNGVHITGHRNRVDSLALSNEQSNSNISRHRNGHSREIMCELESHDELFTEDGSGFVPANFPKVWQIKTAMEETGTGFFYKIELDSKEICGLFTNNHVISCYNYFVITLSNEQLTKSTFPVRKEDVKYFFTDCLMDVTFLVFNETFTDYIKTISGFDCFHQFSFVPNGETEIFAFGHPLGQRLKKSQGKILSSGTKAYDKDYDIRYKLDTLCGSSGSAVVTKEGDLLGIHKSGGILLDCLCLDYAWFSEDNKGTRMEMAVNLIKEQKKLYDDLQNCEGESKLPDEKLVLEGNALCVVFDKDDNELGEAFLCEISFPFIPTNMCGLLTSSHVKQRRNNPLPQTNSSPPEYGWTLKFPLKLKFQHSKCSNICFQKDDVLLECTDDMLHFSFLLIKPEYFNTIGVTNYKFLPISNNNDNIFPLDVFLLSENTADDHLMVKVEQTKCDRMLLFSHHTNLPGKEGTPILNGKRQVIGIRRTCGPKHVFGTYVAVGDTVIKNIFDQYQLLPCTIPKMSKKKKHKFTSYMPNFCKIYATKTMTDGKQMNLEGSGFLCSIPTSSDHSIKGLLTTKIMINKKTTIFQLRMINNNKPFIYYIFPSDIRWMFCDDDLHISFVAFRDSFLHRLGIKKFLNTNIVKEDEEIIATSRFTKDNKLDLRVGKVIEIHGSDFYHTADISSDGTGSPLLSKKLEVVGIHRGMDSNVRIATCMESVIERVEKESKNQMGNLSAGSAESRLSSFMNQVNLSINGLLCSISRAGNRILNGLLIQKRIDETTNEITISTNEGPHKLEIQLKDLFEFHGNPCATFIQLSQSNMNTMTEKGLPFLSIYRHELDHESSGWLNFQGQEENLRNLGNMVDNIQQNLLPENSLLSNKTDECFETCKDSDSVTNLKEQTHHVTYTMTWIVNVLSEAFLKFSEWTVKIGPLAGREAEQVLEKYMAENWYVQKSAEYRQEDYWVVKIRSLGLQTKYVSNKWHEKIRPPLLDKHPGVVWIKACEVTQEYSELQFACIAQPDNGLETNCPQYNIKFYNRSSKQLRVTHVEKNGIKLSAYKDGSVSLSNDNFPDKRYVKLQLQLRDDKKKIVKTAWLFTWKNNSWIVDDDKICRGREDKPDEPMDYNEHEIENEDLTCIPDYKWVFCNQIKCYNWIEVDKE